MGPAPELIWSSDGTTANDKRGSIGLFTQNWRRAYGRIAPCECCGSPGNIEVADAHGTEVLQLCAAPDCAPEAWADLLAAVLAAPEATQPESPAPAASIAVPPSHARCVRGDVRALLSLLAALGEEGASLLCELRTSATMQRFEGRFDRLNIEDHVLTAAADSGAWQLGLQSVRGFAVSARGTQETLHVTGPGRAVLLTFSVGATQDAGAVWRAALRAAFPELSSLVFPS